MQCVLLVEFLALAGRTLLRLVRVLSSVEGQVFSVYLCLQGYTLADEEEDPLIYQHRMLRSNQGDALASGPVETGPMKKLHVSTINLQKAGHCFQGDWEAGLCFFLSFKTFGSYCLELTPANRLIFKQCQHCELRSFHSFVCFALLFCFLHFLLLLLCDRVTLCSSGYP